MPLQPKLPPLYEPPPPHPSGSLPTHPTPLSHPTRGPRSVLALHGFFEKPGFVHYLEYLTYWKQPEYARFLMYPHCLVFLGMLQEEEYRARVRRLFSPRGFAGLLL